MVAFAGKSRGPQGRVSSAPSLRLSLAAASSVHAQYGDRRLRPDPTPTADTGTHRRSHADVSAGGGRGQISAAVSWSASEIRRHPGLAGRCGTIRAAAALPKRRGAAFPHLGRALRNFGQHRQPQGDFVGDRRQAGAALRGWVRASRPASMSLFGRPKPHFDRRSVGAAVGDARPDPVRLQRVSRPAGHGPGPSRWSMGSARSIRAATPDLASPAPAITAGSTVR